MHNRRRALFLIGCSFAAAMFLLAQSTARAQSTEKFYYWVTPARAAAKTESFVIAVDSSKAAAIEAIFASGGHPSFSGHIAAGTVNYNRDYYSPDHHTWNWYVSAVDDVFDLDHTGFAACVCPDLVANPSDIAANPNDWINRNGDRYTPEYYQITGKIDPTKSDAVANVSNRGFTGSGEKTLIAGFIVTGGQPRSLVVRALGPSLAAGGVQQFATNPKLDVFNASGQRVAANTDWKTDTRSTQLSQSYPSLAPSNDKEAALLLTLMPGSYTLQGSNEDGSDGVMLLEAYDADSGS